jgi:DNA polymerase-4
MSKERAIILIDMDSFFASCHIAKDNSLKDKPIVVASPNARSIVSTASYPARKFGINSGMPVFMAREKCDDLIIIEPDFNLYVETSNNIFKHVKEEFSRHLEVISIDEGYVDVTNEWKKYGSVKKMCDEIRNSVYKKFNLTCSIGISTNKFLAKMASEMNKPNGCFTLLQKDIDKFLWPLPIEKMYGVGRATKEILNNENIFFIKDAAQFDQNFFIKKFGKRGISLFENINGIGEDTLKELNDESKSISNEMTLMRSTSSIQEIDDLYFELAKLVTKRLTNNFQKAKVVSVHFKYEYNYNYDGFNKVRHSQRTHHQHTFVKHTNKLEDIFSAVKELFYELWDERPIFFIGITVGNLISVLKEPVQVSFNNDFEIPTKVDGFNSILRKINSKDSGNLLMKGEEFERKFERNQSKDNAGISKIDAERINEKRILENWKNKK